MENNLFKKIQLFNEKKPSLLRDTKAYNYKYATLDQIQGKINPLFQELGLITIHQVINNKVITKIIDLESGESIQSEIEISTIKPKDKGSEITYYRRYNLLCLLDLEVEDDDGAAAQKSFQKNEIKKNQKKVFGEKEFQNLVEKKDNYIDARSVLGILDEKYVWTKGREDKINDLFK